MTATVDVHTCIFLQLIETKTETKFCDKYKRHFNITAFYRHSKTYSHLAKIKRKITWRLISPEKRRLHQRQR